MSPTGTPEPLPEQGLLDAARAAGYRTLTAPPEKVNPAAVRMLPQTCDGVGVDLAGEVLHVVYPAVPTPAQFRDLIDQAGMNVTVSVATPGAYTATRRAATATQPPASPRVAGAVLTEAADQSASDVLLHTGEVPWVRRHGQLTPLAGYPRLAAADVHEATEWLTGTADRPVTVVEYADCRWRVHTFTAQGRPALTARRLAPLRRLEDLGLPAAAQSLAHATDGLVLVAGPPGSGKTTTLAALVDRVNTHRRCSILTLEDPVEYHHRSRSSVVTHQRVGTDVPSYAAGIADAARRGVEVIVVGDLVEPDAVKAAVSAASAGHLVLAAVTARNTEGTLRRILEHLDPDEQDAVRAQAAAALRAVIAQRLLPDNTGGTQLVPEVLLRSDATTTLVRTGRLHELAAVMDNSVEAGMSTLERALAQYVTAGRLETEIGREHAVDTHRFDGYLTRAHRGRQDDARQ
jgi:twitching motility protein PilT